MTKSIENYEKRTIAGLTETDEGLLKTQAYKNMRMGRLKDPLLYIDLDNWVPDELHLMLRITDVMTKNLIIAAACYDLKKGRRSKDILHGPMVNRLIQAINSCGVSFSVRDSDKKVFNCTSLVGGDKLKLLKKLPPKLLENKCQPRSIRKKVEKLWTVCTVCGL